MMHSLGGNLALSLYSPSDMGSPKLPPRIEAISASTYDDTGKQFLLWLHAISVQFLHLDDSRRIQILDTLISVCGSKELVYLTDMLPNLLYRDFLRMLPTEISVRILMVLDERSLLNCCLVSKYWNQLINSFRELWIHMAKRVGACILMEPYISIHKYKQMFMQYTYLAQQMENKAAFESLTLEGHQGRVMAVTHNKDLVATGSDDHTVRFWDIHSGDCIKVIHTHSVSALQFDDVLLYTASYDNTAACWEIDTGQLVCRYIGHTAAVFSLDSKRNMNLLVTGSADKTVKIWQLSSGALLQTLSDWHNDWVTHVKILSFTTESDNIDNNTLLLEHGTLQLVSVDRQGCCFWTIRHNDSINVSVTHMADWCTNVPNVIDGYGISVCTWNKRDKLQVIAHYNTETVGLRCVPRHKSSLILPRELPPKQTVLGIGQKFAIFMVDEDYSRIVIVDCHSSRIMFSIPIPPYRPTQNGASAALGSFDWLNGFTEINRTGLFLVVCLKDNNILLLKWKDKLG